MTSSFSSSISNCDVRSRQDAGRPGLAIEGDASGNIGESLEGFDFHAWVEVEDRQVTDRRIPVRLAYSVMGRYPLRRIVSDD